MLTRIPILFLAICAGSWICGCKKLVDFPEDQLAERTVMVYIAANNNLRAAALASMKQLEEGFRGVTTGSLMVYLQVSAHEAHLIRVGNGMDGMPTRDTLKAYGGENS